MKRPVWLLNRAVLAAHRRLLAEHGGAPGADLPHLALALGWPKTVFAIADARLSLFDLAAAYAEALLRLRPFASSNERMAWLLARLFLAVNGADLPAPAAEQIAMLRALGSGRIGRAHYAQWMLMRRVVACRTDSGAARDRNGRVPKVGVRRRTAARPLSGVAAARGAPTPAPVPMLQD